MSERNILCLYSSPPPQIIVILHVFLCLGFVCTLPFLCCPLVNVYKKDIDRGNCQRAAKNRWVFSLQMTILERVERDENEVHRPVRHLLPITPCHLPASVSKL